ncbi:MAG: ArsR/SmtB family transcription factor [Acidobacteriota bacterium]
MSATAPTNDDLDVLDDVQRVAAILPQIRRRILRSLDRPDSATGLARRLGLHRQKVNYHLRELERQGFVELAEERRRRGCVERRMRPTARAYLVSPALLGDLAADPERIQDRFSSTYLIAVAARLVRDLTTLRQRAARAQKSLATLTLQVDIGFASPAAREAFAEELAGTLARLAARHHSDAPGARRHHFTIGGHPVITRKEKEP